MLPCTWDGVMLLASEVALGEFNISWRCFVLLGLLPGEIPSTTWRKVEMSQAACCTPSEL